MANQPDEITPSLMDAFIQSAKIPDEPINNGPLVYNLTKEASLNGIDPRYYNQNAAEDIEAMD